MPSLQHPSEQFVPIPVLWLNMRFRAQRIDHISITEYVVNSSGWDHSLASSSFLFSFSFSLPQCPFLLESFDWHVSHHLISYTTQVSFCTTNLRFFVLLLNCFSRSTITLYATFYKSLLQASLYGIIHFFDYRLESFHRNVPPAWSYYINQSLLQILGSCSVFPYIYH